MKKLVSAALIATAFAASAAEIGVTGVESTAQGHRYGQGITIGEKNSSFGVTAGFSRFYRENDDQNRWSLVVDKEVVKVGPLGLTGRVGYAYLDNKNSSDGSALTLGTGASVGLMKNVSLAVSVDRQYGQSKVQQFNGNIVTAGIKVGY